MTHHRPSPLGAPTPRRLLAAGLIVLSFAPAGCRKTAAAGPEAVASPAVPQPAPALAESAGYDLRPSEKVAIDEFLRRNPGLRAAADDDHRTPDDGEGVGAFYAVYHPYFVRGEANDDGLLDFVLGFVRRDSDRAAPWFSIVVFFGRPDGTFSPGAFLERDISLADGDLSLDRDSIVVTPDVSEDVSRRYRWDAAKKRHVFVRDDAPEEPPTPAPAQI